MRIILLVTLIAFTACKKTDEAKTDPAAADKKAAEPAKDDTKPAEGTPPQSKITSANDYEARATDMTNKLLALFVDAGKDCDKLATNVSKYADDNREVFEALKAYEQANPDAEKRFDEKMKGREKELEEKLAPSFDACKDHAGMKTAMEKLPL